MPQTGMRKLVLKLAASDGCRLPIIAVVVAIMIIEVSFANLSAMAGCSIASRDSYLSVLFPQY
jgi:hypothetical protein